MTNLFAQYETDRSKETEGVEIDIDGAIFICRRAGGGNRRYRFALADAALRHRDILDSKDDNVVMSAEDDVTMDTFANSVIIDWREVTDRAGEPWPFSKENFLDLMRSCPDVWNQLRMEARSVDNYRMEEVQEVAEKLGNE